MVIAHSDVRPADDFLDPNQPVDVFPVSDAPADGESESKILMTVRFLYLPLQKLLAIHSYVNVK
jgi:hypothetical protein